MILLFNHGAALDDDNNEFRLQRHLGSVDAFVPYPDASEAEWIWLEAPAADKAGAGVDVAVDDKGLWDLVPGGDKIPADIDAEEESDV